MQRIFVSTAVTLFIVCIVVGCGEEEGPLSQFIEEEEALSELIIGSWVLTVTELAAFVVPVPGFGFGSAQLHFTLSFYRNGRFDNIFEMSFSLAGEVANVKVLTRGTYHVFDSSLVLRVTESDVISVTPHDFRAFIEGEVFEQIFEAMESMFTDTFAASVEGDILTFDEATWQKL